jgi:RNA polymerase sigma factor (TIGR02999 family)
MAERDSAERNPEEATPAEAMAIDRFAREVVAQATEGEPGSLDELLPLVYDEFRSLASCVMRGERAEHTLRPTALAHEAYLRLARETRTRVRGRGHLLALAATAMRRVLIDYARTHKAQRRGGGRPGTTLPNSLWDESVRPIDTLDLDRALERLGNQDPRKLQAVELIYVCGLTFDETAEILGVATRTVVRDWRFAKSWLWRELSRDLP